jgi:hypothetical protein
MISYTLHCDRGHEFDAWFRSSTDYDKAAGKTACPICNSKKIEKALMAPSVARTDRDAPMRVAAPDPRQIALRQALREIRQKVTENADYVGDKFAEEARKIHYNEVEARGIYGEATPDDAKALIEEGIEFHPLPVLPEEGN